MQQKHDANANYVSIPEFPLDLLHTRRTWTPPFKNVLYQSATWWMILIQDVANNEFFSKSNFFY